MTNRNRNSKPQSATEPQSATQPAIENRPEEGNPTMENQPQTATATANPKTGKPEEEGEKLISFNVTTSILRRLPEGGFKHVLSFRPTVRGPEFWAAMKKSVAAHVPNPRSFDKTNDHVYVESVGEPDIVTYWAIRRSDQRCPICGQPASEPTDWCHDAFCENARTAEPAEKKTRRVENPAAFDI